MIFIITSLVGGFLFLSTPAFSQSDYNLNTDNDEYSIIDNDSSIFEQEYDHPYGAVPEQEIQPNKQQGQVTAGPQSTSIAHAENKDNFQTKISRINKQQELAWIEVSSGVQAGSTFKAYTSSGYCYLSFQSKLNNTTVRVSTKECRQDDLYSGQPIQMVHNQRVVASEPTVTMTSNQKISESYLTQWLGKDFYNNYIDDKAQVYLGYHIGNLTGAVDFSTNTQLNKLSGGHTMSLGFDYQVYRFKTPFSFYVGGNYQLPRSFGDNNFSGAALSLDKTPTLFTWNIYTNVQYDITEDIHAYLGINRLMGEIKYLPADTSGDFGFHLGANYHFKELFVGASLNLYQMDVRTAVSSSNLSLNEFAIRVGTKL